MLVSMSRSLVDRLALALLFVLEGDGATLEHVAAAVALVVWAVVDALLRWRERGGTIAAVQRAHGLHPEAEPLDDAQLRVALRRAGISSRAMERASVARPDA